MQGCLSWRTLRTLAAAVCVLLVPLAALAQVGTISLEDDDLAGQPVSQQADYTASITVAKSAPIAGDVNVVTYNSTGSDLPMGYAAIWGDRTVQNFLDDDLVAPGIHQYVIHVNTTAAPDVGLYHLVFSFEDEDTSAQMFSATNRLVPGAPTWYDYNDIGWDWAPADYLYAETYGNVEVPYLRLAGYVDRFVPAAVIDVNVVEPNSLLYLGQYFDAYGSTVLAARATGAAGPAEGVGVLFRLTNLTGSVRNYGPISTAATGDDAPGLAEGRANVPVDVWSVQTLNPGATYAASPRAAMAIYRATEKGALAGGRVHLLAGGCAPERWVSFGLRCVKTGTGASAKWGPLRFLVEDPHGEFVKPDLSVTCQPLSISATTLLWKPTITTLGGGVRTAEIVGRCRVKDGTGADLGYYPFRLWLKSSPGVNTDEFELGVYKRDDFLDAVYEIKRSIVRTGEVIVKP